MRENKGAEAVDAKAMGVRRDTHNHRANAFFKEVNLLDRLARLVQGLIL